MVAYRFRRVHFLTENVTVFLGATDSASTYYSPNPSISSLLGLQSSQQVRRAIVCNNSGVQQVDKGPMVHLE